MRALPLLLLTPLAPMILSAQASSEPAPPPKEVAGKDLPAVPGPLVERYCGVPGYHDPAEGPGVSRFDLQIRSAARRGPSIPALGLPSEPVAVSDTVGTVAGWKAYRVEVPPGAKVHARIHAAHEAWFIVRTVNRMGTLEKGMLQNLIPTGNPEASYTNPKTKPNIIYFVVDTTETNMDREPYTLVVEWPKVQPKAGS